MQYTIRVVTKDDIPFLWEMLYQSIFVPEGQEPLDKDIINEPSISKYVEGWGSDGDFGFKAVGKTGTSITMIVNVDEND